VHFNRRTVLKALMFLLPVRRRGSIKRALLERLMKLLSGNGDEMKIVTIINKQELVFPFNYLATLFITSVDFSDALASPWCKRSPRLPSLPFQSLRVCGSVAVSFGDTRSSAAQALPDLSPTDSAEGRLLRNALTARVSAGVSLCV